MKESTPKKKFTLDGALQLLKQFQLQELESLKKVLLIEFANGITIPAEISHKYSLFAQVLKSQLGSIYTSPEVEADAYKAADLFLETLSDNPRCYDEKMPDKIVAIFDLLEIQPLLFGEDDACGQYGSYLSEFWNGINTKLIEFNEANKAVPVPEEMSKGECTAYVKTLLLIKELDAYRNHLEARRGCKNIAKQSDKKSKREGKLAVINSLFKTLYDPQSPKDNFCNKLKDFQIAFEKSDNQKKLLKNSDNIAKRILFTIANILTFGLIPKFSGYSFWYNPRAINFKKIVEGVLPEKKPQEKNLPVSANNGQLELTVMSDPLRKV